jgi:secreted trypsin-like serine protease
MATASIVGGHRAPATRMPWLAYVVYRPNSYHFEDCTGTVISPHLVLTAGHCVVGEHTGDLLDASRFTVVVGSDDRESPTAQRLAVSQVIPYPDFRPAASPRGWGWGDASILVLVTPTTQPR